MIIPDIGLFEYSNSNVILGYDPGIEDDPQFQYLKIKEAFKGFDGIKVIIALDYEYPKSSYLVLGKQICDELKNLRNRFSSSEAKEMITNEFLKGRVENLIIQCGTLTHLRFSNEFKLKSVKWNDKTPIGVFGLDKAGKSSILSYLATGEIIEEYTPTLGLNRYTMPGVLGADWEPIFLELSGRLDFRPLWHEYEDLTAIIFVIDSEDRERIKESISELEKLLKNPKFMRLPFSVIVNKQDLPTSKELSSITSLINEISSSSYRISIFPASGQTGEGLTAALHWVLEYVWWLAQNPEE